MALKVVIFDVSDTVLTPSKTAVVGVAATVSLLRAAGVRVAMTANAPSDRTTRDLTKAGIEFDLVVGTDTTSTRKPSPLFCQLAGQKFGAAPHEMLYVGDNDKTDAICAVNAGVMYLAALWANPEPRYGMPVDDPPALLRFIFRFMLAPPHWYWVLDRKDGAGSRAHVRALLPATRDSFNLKRVLKEDTDLRVEGLDFWGFLSRRLLTSLTLDGLLADVDTWVWYPGHAGAPPKPRYATAFTLASQLFRDRHLPDLLVRHRPAIKLAYSRKPDQARPTISSQTHTVHLNPAHRAHVVGKHVLVADDFCTDGLSFEWARTLLFAGGARDVTCIAFGRYRDEYLLHTLKPAVTIDPWAPCSIGDDAFRILKVRGTIDTEAQTETERLIRLKPPGTTELRKTAPRVTR